MFCLFLFYYFPDINNKDIRDANKANDESDDEGESMDWWSKYFASLDKLIMVKFSNCQNRGNLAPSVLC